MYQIFAVNAPCCGPLLKLKNAVTCYVWDLSSFPSLNFMLLVILTTKLQILCLKHLIIVSKQVVESSKIFFFFFNCYSIWLPGKLNSQVDFFHGFRKSPGCSRFALEFKKNKTFLILSVINVLRLLCVESCDVCMHTHFYTSEKQLENNAQAAKSSIHNLRNARIKVFHADLVQVTCVCALCQNVITLSHSIRFLLHSVFILLIPGYPTGSL